MILHISTGPTVLSYWNWWLNKGILFQHTWITWTIWILSPATQRCAELSSVSEQTDGQMSLRVFRPHLRRLKYDQNFCSNVFCL